MKIFILSCALIFSGLIFSQDSTKVTKVKESKFNVTFAIGPSFRIGKISDNLPYEVQNYLKGLKSGVSYDLNFNYMVNTKTSLGLKFNMYQSKASIGTVYIYSPSGNEGYGRVSDNIKIYFIGPMWSTFFHKKNNDFCMNLALGYMGYVDDANYLGAYEIKGSSLGIEFDIAYFMGITERFQIGPKIAYLGGSIYEFDISGPNNYLETKKLEDDNVEGLARIDLSLAFRYKF